MRIALCDGAQNETKRLSDLQYVYSYDAKSMTMRNGNSNRAVSLRSPYNQRLSESFFGEPFSHI